MRRLQLKDLALGASLILACAAPAVAGNEGAAGDEPARVTWTYDGPVLVTPSGMTLYMNTAEDTKNEKFRWQCTDQMRHVTNDAQSGIGERPTMGNKFLKSCVEHYPPYVADANAKPVGKFAIVERPGGTKQWTYVGYPLYQSIKDRKPGERYGAPPGNFGGGAAGRGGIRIATEAVDLPPGLKFSRHEEGLILATTDPDRPVYTPRDGRRVILASAEGGLYKPIVAPAIARINGDWSVIDAVAGMKQYAFRGKPLYAAPAGLSEREVAEAGGWEMVVIQKSPGRPAAIGKQLALMGEVYTDRKGMTLYTYNCSPGGGAGGGRGGGPSCDDAGGPAVFMVALCGDSKECARRWHPYVAPANAKPEGEFSIVEITYPMFTDPRGTIYPADAPKVKAWAYRGKPLFTYYQDEDPGDIWGDNTKGLWGSSFTAIQVPGRSSFELP